MALSIAIVPVLTESAADRFDEKLREVEAKRDKTDFSQQIEEARRILSKSKLI